MSEESTTPDLAELLRRYLEAGNRRDFEAVERFYARDAVYVNMTGTYEGAGAIRGFVEDMMGTFTGFRLDVEEPLDFGHEVAFVITGQIPGGRDQLETRAAYVATVSEGQIQGLADYIDIDEARAAAERLAEERG